MAVRETKAARSGPGPTRRRTVAVHLVALIGLVSSLLVLGPPASAAPATPAKPQSAAAGETTITFLDEQFDETAFPPDNWEISDPGWTRSCSPAASGGGCTATGTITDSTAGASTSMSFGRLLGTLPTLDNPTLTFTSTFHPDDASYASIDRLTVGQPALPPQEGFTRLAELSGGQPGEEDPADTPVVHTVPLANAKLPIRFNWVSLGDDNASPSKSWDISNVKITGTVEATPHTLTADPIFNNAYHAVAGTPLTITLSGSADPDDETVGFEIVDPPAVGTLGPITQVDAHHATVVWTTPVNACPDPDGLVGLTCQHHFTFKATDLLGNESPVVNAAFDVHPGGAGAQQIVVSAPTNLTYEDLGAPGGGTVKGVVLSPDVSVGPTDFPDQVALHLTVAEGTMQLPNASSGPGGITFLNGTTNSGTQIYMKGSVHKLNTALSLFFYYPPSGSTPDEQIDIRAADLGAEGQAGTIFPDLPNTTTLISAEVVNPKPVLTLPTGPLSVANTGGPLVFGPEAAKRFTLTDAGANASTIDTVVVTVGAGKLSLPGEDLTSNPPLVTRETFDNDTRLHIHGTVANLNTALSHLRFDPTGLGSMVVTLTASASNPNGQGTIPASVPITVILGPSPFGPVAKSTLQNVPVTVPLCASGPPGAVLSFTFTDQPDHGTLVLDPTATGLGCTDTGDRLVQGYTYTPAAGYTGPDSFTYFVTDAHTGLSSAPATFALTVGAHQTPTVLPSTAATSQDTPVVVVVCGTNPDPSPALTFSVASLPQHGSIGAAPAPTSNPCPDPNMQAGAFTYTPLPGTFRANGTDSFTFTASNGAVSAPGTALITVVTKTPQVFSQALSVDENGNIGVRMCSTIPTAGTEIIDVTGPLHGTLDQVSADHNGPACPAGYLNILTRRYVPTFLYAGADQITYRAKSGSYVSDLATVAITVDPIEIPPTANPQSVVVIAPQAVGITLTGSSLHNLPLTYRVVDAPTHGTLTGSTPNLTYTPSIANGTDSFTFVANDGVADGPKATVSITITSPQLSSSTCVTTGPELTGTRYACGAQLPFIADGSGGQIALAHTSGERSDTLRLQTTITNTAAAADTVTLTAPAGTSPWFIQYVARGNVRTAAITGAGYQVTLGPVGSGTESVYVVVDVHAPLNLGSAATQELTVTASSGHNPSVRTASRVRVQDGTSSPSLTVSQLDGTGATSFPDNLAIQPPLVAGGPGGGALIKPNLVGTGVNTFRMRVDPTSGAGVTARYLLGTTDVTSQILAGTLEIRCFGPNGCPTVTVQISAAAGAPGGGYSAVLELRSTIDGQSTNGLFSVDVTNDAGGDLYASADGQSVFEATPVTQVVDTPVGVDGTVTRQLRLLNRANVADTITVSSATTRVAGDNSSISVTAVPIDGGTSGPVTAAPVEVGGQIADGAYRLKMLPQQLYLLTVTDHSKTQPDLAPTEYVLTTRSALAPTRVDSFRLRFPNYSFRPDAVLTGPDGAEIGARTYSGPSVSVFDNPQTTTFNTDLSPQQILVTLVDRGKGPWPTGTDPVTVKAPASDVDFDLSYAMRAGGTDTDVTAAITGAGLNLDLRQPEAAQTLVITATSAATSRTGRPGRFPISVTSRVEGVDLSDSVVVGLFTQGNPQLRFGGLPQPEPQDVTIEANRSFPNRVAPVPSRGYEKGAFYGAYPDPTGQKFVYVSGWDKFDLQIASEKVVDTTYRIDVVRPTTTGRNGLPNWAAQVYGASYLNAGKRVTPGDPLGTGGVNPKFTIDGKDVTAGVRNGSYSTPSIHSRDTLDIHVAFAPPTGSSQRFAPMRINIVNVATGRIEDSLTIAVSTILTCDDSVEGQQLLNLPTKAGDATLDQKLAFRAFDRAAPAGLHECIQHLSDAWITKSPVVFGSYDPKKGTEPPGGYDPKGLWVSPQDGGIVRIEEATHVVTTPKAILSVDTPIVDDHGNPDGTAVNVVNYVGTYTDLTWDTLDRKNGIKIPDNALGRSPFPLVVPSPGLFGPNTMEAARYFQVQPQSGTPYLAGQMSVNQPWFHDEIKLHMDVLNGSGLLLSYPAPEGATAKLPGDDETVTGGFFWTVHRDGKVVQGGCLGLPPTFFKSIGEKAGLTNDLPNNPKACKVFVQTTFGTIPGDPNVKADIEKIEIEATPVGFMLGIPTFNVVTLDGYIDFAQGTVQKVFVHTRLNIGPITPCYAAQRARPKGVSPTPAQRAEDSQCPQNYFQFDARVTFKQGHITDQPATDPKAGVGPGFGVRFEGDLLVTKLFKVASIEIDVQSNPFKLHFVANLLDFEFDAGISVAAKFTIEGSMTEDEFALGLKGSATVMGHSVAGMEGIMSTRGIGACGTFAGESLGASFRWGDPEVKVFEKNCSLASLDPAKTPKGGS